jgi:hypothetical protein
MRCEDLPAFIRIHIRTSSPDVGHTLSLMSPISRRHSRKSEMAWQRPLASA